MSTTNNKERRLGKGLEALIPRSLISSGRTIMSLPIKDITENPYQPRKHFNEENIDDLCQSIQEHGLIQPILVRRKGAQYELVAGERRLRACKKLKMNQIPALIRDMTDKESLQIALIENLHRADLNSIEVGKGYKRLIEEFQMTHESIGKIFNKSRTAITNTLRLLNLPEEIQETISKGEISEGHGRVLAGLNEAEQTELLNSILKNKLTVRQAESESKNPSASGNQKEVPSHILHHHTKSISDKLKLKVTGSGHNQKGKITIHYNSNQELMWISNRLMNQN